MRASLIAAALLICACGDKKTEVEGPKPDAAAAKDPTAFPTNGDPAATMNAAKARVKAAEAALQATDDALEARVQQATQQEK